MRELAIIPMEPRETPTEPGWYVVLVGSLPEVVQGFAASDGIRFWRGGISAGTSTADAFTFIARVYPDRTGRAMVDGDALTDLMTRALALIPEPARGLPDPAFAFALKTVPMPSVDLLVRDGADRVLLVWRADAYATGWHFPGGILRLGESLSARVSAVAEAKLGLAIEAEAAPCHVQEFTAYARGHFVSLLFRCRPAAAFARPDLFGDPARPRPGDLAWFASPPPDAYAPQRAYHAAVWGL